MHLDQSVYGRPVFRGSMDIKTNSAYLRPGISNQNPRMPGLLSFKRLINLATSMSKPRVFFDITADNQQLGRVVMELYSDVCPKTAENFRSLCTGDKGI